MKTLLLGAALAFATLPALPRHPGNPACRCRQRRQSCAARAAWLRWQPDHQHPCAAAGRLPPGQTQGGLAASHTIQQAVVPFDNHGTTVRDDVSEIKWRGGNLADDFYNEFVFRGTLPAKAGETAWFKVVQKGEPGETYWDEIPADGKAAAKPAAGIKLTPPANPAHRHQASRNWSKKGALAPFCLFFSQKKFAGQTPRKASYSRL